MAISSINPATGQTLKIFTELTDDEVDGAWPGRRTPSGPTGAPPSPNGRPG